MATAIGQLHYQECEGERTRKDNNVHQKEDVMHGPENHNNWKVRWHTENPNLETEIFLKRSIVAKVHAMIVYEVTNP